MSSKASSLNNLQQSQVSSHHHPSPNPPSLLQQPAAPQENPAFRLNEELREKQNNKTISSLQDRIEQLQLRNFTVEEEKVGLAEKVELLEF